MHRLTYIFSSVVLCIGGKIPYYVKEGAYLHSMMQSDGNNFAAMSSWTALTRNLGMKTTF